MPRSTYNVMSDSVLGNLRALALAVQSAAGRNVKVAPFDDDAVRKLGVWVEGEKADVEIVLAGVEKGLKETKDGYSAVPYVARRR